MQIRVFRHFEDADADSLKIELFLDGEATIRAWYIGPLVRMAKEFVLPFTPRERNLRAETAIARVAEIALAADLPVALIDPDHLWDELWISHRRADRFFASVDPQAEDRSRRRRLNDLIVARANRAAAPRLRYDRDTT